MDISRLLDSNVTDSQSRGLAEKLTASRSLAVQSTEHNKPIAEDNVDLSKSLITAKEMFGNLEPQSSTSTKAYSIELSISIQFNITGVSFADAIEMAEKGSAILNETLDEAMGELKKLLDQPDVDITSPEFQEKFQEVTKDLIQGSFDAMSAMMKVAEPHGGNLTDAIQKHQAEASKLYENFFGSGLIEDLSDHENNMNSIAKDLTALMTQ